MFGDGFNSFDSPEYKAWDEAEDERAAQNFTDKIASMKASPPEIAELTCNRARIYK